MKTPAALCYIAYCAAVGGTTFDGKPLPTFAELGDRQKEGWKAAADSLGLPVKIGGPAATKNGVKGTVRSISLQVPERRGVWIEGLDSTGRPFEHYAEISDLVVDDSPNAGPATVAA